ncbi:conserved hypothetical protein [Thiomonas arsenitoxydans]|uniref:Uncharacterized protein n=1 Tax=Thiomonas arsenitoxydans (strain DSM 22701 / CIP 110005 / 3As) TaxID=426114 RepID=D6CV12_THIA3|nr:hypothetical protein THI_2506 [Thiomonas arsenitoxydans]CDW92985.1 conserved hypothetical protein [Thiomonas sp. CB2]CQR45316.1 conserved hypothetical protein [Thiomonas sp. CB3]VDY06493.1 conserved protein of unknown function [Thiomonas sp. Bio17B3]VDY10211.1 conserved protein of unknown function [Thiomonas sp. Sup16B3]VDY14766.1 hypothetical protein TOC7_31196 [Thiomonas sp. OC7]
MSVLHHYSSCSPSKHVGIKT